MKFSLPVIITILIIHTSISSDRSFVDGIPLVTKQGAAETSSSLTVPDDNVRELQDLKESIGNTLEMMKSHSTMYSNMNGEKQAHSEHHEEVDANGKLIARINQKIDTDTSNGNNNPSAKVHTEINVPSKGIHKNIYQQYPVAENIAENVAGNVAENVAELENKRMNPIQETNNNIERYNFANGIQYSPLDMAEYVFWTGDEKGVTLAIEEFLQEGLMSREEAISFLQEIKYNLEYLQTHYTQLGLNARDISNDNARNNVKIDVKNKQKQELRNNFDLNQLRQETVKKSESEFVTNKLSKNMEQDKQNLRQEDEYEELLERLRLADFLYTEYSLEEIIYQLAKVMFTQSLTKSSAEAQKALQKFTTFLETEAEQGHLSKALEKKVLDVLIAALTDTLSEHPNLISDQEKYNLVVQPQQVRIDGQQVHVDGQQILRQILQLSPEEKAIVRAALLPFKDENNNQNPNYLKRNPLRNDNKNINQLNLHQGTYLAP